MAHDKRDEDNGFDTLFAVLLDNAEATDEAVSSSPSLWDPDSPTRSIDWPVPRPDLQQAAYAAYESLNQGEIRLLRLLPGQGDDTIHCETSTTSLASTPAYEAISYAWGTSVNLVDICFNGTSRLTRHNLADCLRTLRYEDAPRVLWVDTLCMTFSVPTSHVTEEVQ
jgi:hypothetical protein